MMEVGSRAGYYTSKSPKMILHEWCNRANLPKPRYKAIALEDGRFRCKVVILLLCGEKDPGSSRCHRHCQVHLSHRHLIICASRPATSVFGLLTA